MSTTYEGSHQQYEVVCDSNVMMPMRDGLRLATDLYFPAAGESKAPGPFPVILERTPYNKAAAGNVTKGKYFARRGYVCAMQDVRGRYASEGEWYAFATEATDGYDTVEWLGAQPWSAGKVGTMGDSYCGSDQSALATLNPAHLGTMIVGVGASNYYHSSMRQNGALEQRFQMYIFRMAATSKEALVRLTSEQMPQIIRSFPLREGATALSRLPSYERWALDILTHGEYDDYWKQRGYAISEYYNEHADVPTLYLGGWYDTYTRNTCASFTALSKMKRSRQVLMMGRWTHVGYEVPYSGELDFGTEAHINYNDLKLAWFDHFLKGLHTEVAEWSQVRIFTMGTGDEGKLFAGTPGGVVGPVWRINYGGYWRKEPDWPPPGTRLTPYYLQGDGSLSPSAPADGAAPPSCYTFDPTDPVPTIGVNHSAADGIMDPGGYDQRGRPGFIGCRDTLPINARGDVLTFQTPILDEDTEVTGPLEMHLWASSSAVDTDFTAKLIDVYPPTSDYPGGLAFNITDSIIRPRYRGGWETPELMTPGQPYEFVLQLYPTSNVFKKGHRIRLDVSSSNWPRFDVNPNTGGPLGLERRHEVAHQTVYHDTDHPSHIVLPIKKR